MSIHKVHHRLKRTGPDDGIGIEQQEILRRIRLIHGRPQDHVIATGKSEVGRDRLERAPPAPPVLVDNALDLGGGIASCAILADRDINTRHDLARHRVQTIDRELRHAVINDNNQELHNRVVTDL